MAVTKEQKKLFNEKVKPYKNFLDDLKKEVSTLRVAVRKNARLAPYIEMRLAQLSLQKSSTLVLMSRLSLKIQNFKNESYCNDARKEISSNLASLMKIVGEDLDGGLSENKEKLKLIERMTPYQRLQLLRGFKAVTEELKEVLGSNSKWRWYFPDLHLKTAILARNMFDFSTYEKISKKPDADDYRSWLDFFQFLTDELQLAAQEYRSRYELSTKEVSDLQAIQKIFEFTKKIYLLTGNKTELNKVSTSLDAINEMIETTLGKGKKGGGKK